MARILIIDDDKRFCSLLSAALEDAEYDISSAYSLREGMKCISEDNFDVVFLDVQLPDGNGLDKITDIYGSASAPEVIILTGVGTKDGAELAIKCGAWDYIQKPASINDMRLTLIRALNYREEKVKKITTAALKMDSIIGKSLKMKACYDVVAEAAACDANVLITGETGTGKELFAKAVHENSRRAGRAFVIVDCAALTDNLTESALFGYERGAFTGADQRREGLIKQADGGTLFLDEIGELPIAMQKSFLRVLQEHRYRPLGSVKEVESDFRLIAATNRDLDLSVEAGHFRKDLLFRLCAITLDLPPLREHLDDLSEIALFHTARICKRSLLEPKELSADFMEALLAYDWPGNVRELVNALERSIAAALSTPTLFSRHLPTPIRVKIAQNKTSSAMESESPSVGTGDANYPKLKDLRESSYALIEKNYLQNLMKFTGGDIAKACRLSDLSRTRFYELLKKHQIDVADQDEG